MQPASRASPGAARHSGGGPCDRSCGRSIALDGDRRGAARILRPAALESALQDMKWVGTVAMAHEQVVEQFSRQRGCTVVPMKLFTMFSTEKRAVEATRSRAREIAAIGEADRRDVRNGVCGSRGGPKAVARKSASVDRAASRAPRFSPPGNRCGTARKTRTRIGGRECRGRVRTLATACARRAQAQ